MRLQAAAEHLLQLASLASKRPAQLSLVKSATAPTITAPADLSINYSYSSQRAQEQTVCQLLRDGQFDRAADAYNPTMTLPKTSYTQLIEGYLNRNQLQMASRIYQHMRFTGCRPSLDTFARLISANCPNDLSYTAIHEPSNALRFYRDLRIDGVCPDGRIFRPLIFNYFLRTGEWRTALELAQEWQRFDRTEWIGAVNEMMSGLLDLHETNRAPIDGCLLLFHSALSSSQPAGSNNSNGRCENNNHKMLSDLNWNRLLWRLLLREKRPREAWLILQQMRTRGIQLSFPWKS